MSIEEMIRKGQTGIDTIDTETGRQPLDVVKEMFTSDNKEAKSNLSQREIILVTKVRVFARQYRIPMLNTLIDQLLVLKRSEGGKAFKTFGDTLAKMNPQFSEKTEQGGMKV